jgi:hypothetical protein
MTLSATRSASTGPIGGERASDYDGRLIAEALRYHDAAGAPGEDRRAEDAARNAVGDLEHKIIVHARHRDSAVPMGEALHHFRSALRIAFILAAGVAFIAGIATAHTALTAPQGMPVNFHWALLGMLGVETVVLVLWIVFALVSRGESASPSLGGVVYSAGRWLVRLLHRDAIQLAMVRAMAAVNARGSIARWSFGAITHGLWLSFLAGALAMTLLSLSVKQVNFVWQTTILSERSYVPATQALAALPRLVGFAAPTADEIRASRWAGQGAPPLQVSRAWAELLVASLILYGIAPRLLLFVLCWFRRAAAIRGFRLDLDLPEYQRLRDRLMAPARETRVLDEDDEDVGANRMEPVASATISFSGPVALIGLEIEIPATGWPPDAPRIAWRDLGSVDTREDRERVIDALRSQPPGLILVAVSLLTSPDRGVRGFLARLGGIGATPVALLLTDATRLAKRFRAKDAEQRLADWRRLCGDAGIPPNRAIPYELSKPGAEDRDRLAILLGSGPP